MSSRIHSKSRVGRVPAGSALAVDRDLFSSLDTEKLEGNPLITVVREDVVREPTRLLDLLRSASLPALNCVPSLWQTLVALIKEGEAPPPSLKTLALGGEEIPPGLHEISKHANTVCARRLSVHDMRQARLARPSQALNST